MTLYLTALACLVAGVVVGLLAGSQMRKDHNRDLYIDEQNKRVAAEAALAQKNRELVDAWQMIRVSDLDSVKQERTRNKLLCLLAETRKERDALRQRVAA